MLILVPSFDALLQMSAEMETVFLSLTFVPLFDAPVEALAELVFVFLTFNKILALLSCAHRVTLARKECANLMTVAQW